MANETLAAKPSDKKVALVIGNSYTGASRVSGSADARGMADALKDLGFTLLDPVIDGNLAKMKSALAALRAKIAQAEVVLFFFSGHGYQIQDKGTFLLPAGSPIDPKNLQLSLDEVLLNVSGAPDKAIKLLFLDACRSNASLPTVGGGKLGSVAGFSQGLSRPQSGIPPQTVIAYAADFGQAAVSGDIGGISPYTSALLASIREPGLEIRQFLARVRNDVFRLTRRTQTPNDEGLTKLSQSFYFREPVTFQATIQEADSDLFVFLHGEVVQTASKPRQEPIPLRAGDNPLMLMVAKGKNFHNNHDWSVTEGWHYKITLKFSNGTEQIFQDDGESVPFKAGPHHGTVFVVARANLFVNPDSPQVTVTVKDPDSKIWQREAPFWAQDQDLLFKQKVTDLNLTPDDVLGSAVNLGPLAPLLHPLLAEFLKTGKIFGAKLADPANTFITVRGNRKLKPVVEFCMTEQQQRVDRIRNLKASMTAVFSRVARPFELFDLGLMAALRAKAPEMGIKEPPEDLRIWTALEEDSPAALALASPRLAASAVAAAAVEAPAVETAEIAADVTAVSEELTALAQDSLFHPRPDEVSLGPSPFEQVVQGVSISAQVYTFLSIGPMDDGLRFHARVVADLSDLQNKIGPLIDTIPLPTDNCSRFGDDNVVARIWGKAITVSGNTATLTLHGDVDVWTCRKNPIPCTRVDWVDQRGPFGVTIRVPQVVTFDCNPPIKNRNLNQPFDATLPFSVERVDSRTYALKLGEPQVNLGGTFGGVTEGILRIAGVDINARVKEALDRAVKPELLKQQLPDFLLPLDPSLTRAELVSNAGALALALEMDATLDFKALGELLQRHFSAS